MGKRLSTEMSGESQQDSQQEGRESAEKTFNRGIWPYQNDLTQKLTEINGRRSFTSE